MQPTSEKNMSQQIEKAIQTIADKRSKGAISYAVDEACAEVHQGRCYNPQDKHLIKPYALNGQQENSKEIFLYWWQRRATPDPRHADVKDRLKDYYELNDQAGRLRARPPWRQCLQCC